MILDSEIKNHTSTIILPSMPLPAHCRWPRDCPSWLCFARFMLLIPHSAIRIPRAFSLDIGFVCTRGSSPGQSAITLFLNNTYSLAGPSWLCFARFVLLIPHSAIRIPRAFSLVGFVCTIRSTAVSQVWRCCLYLPGRLALFGRRAPFAVTPQGVFPDV